MYKTTEQLQLKLCHSHSINLLRTRETLLKVPFSSGIFFLICISFKLFHFFYMMLEIDSKACCGIINVSIFIYGAESTGIWFILSDNNWLDEPFSSAKRLFKTL